MDPDRVTAPLKGLKKPLTFAFLIFFTLRYLSNDALDPHGSLILLISFQCTFRICKLIFNFQFLQGHCNDLVLGMAIQLTQLCFLNNI